MSATARDRPPLGDAELTLLADFSQAIAMSLDLETTLRESVRRIADHMQAEAAALFLVQGQQIVCRASFGAVDIRGLALPLGKGIVGRTIRQNREQLIPDVQQDPDFAGNLVSGFVARTMVCTPLSTAAGPIGALQLLNRRCGRPFEQQDADFLRLLASPTALALNNARLAGELLEQDRIKREFELARQMQKDLLPPRSRRGAVYGVNLPAREVSGDFYDHFPLADGRIAFFIGDVSGKGMDAAMLMVRTSALLKLVGKEGRPPASWLTRVNDELTGTLSRGLFVCVLAGTYEPETGVVVFASAGIPPAIHRTADGRSCSFLAGGPPLGIVAGAAFEEQRLCLAGGSLYCFTDGLTDLRDDGGRLLGVEGVQELLASVDALSPTARLRAIVRQARRKKLPDDTTLLLLVDHGRAPRLLAGVGCCCEFDNLATLRQVVGDTLGDLGLPRSERQRLVLALDEAAANVMRHAYGGDCHGRIELSIWLVGDTLEFRLRDWAAPVDCARIRPRDLAEVRPGGLGINLIDEVMDDWAIQPTETGTGNLWVAHKRLDGCRR